MKNIPTVEEAGAIAVGLSEELDAKEQAFFVAGFQEAIKYLLSNAKVEFSERIEVSER
jgi:hypothetical protein